MNVSLNLSVRSFSGTALLLVLLLVVNVPVLNAQEDDSAKIIAKQSQASEPDEKTCVREIYEMTKTAKSAKDFTSMIERCNEVLEIKLSPANFKYVTSLSGWALNRRAESRYELYLQLKAIGNAQSKEVLSQAMEDFDRAVAADPQRHRSWMSRGIANIETEDYRQAALDFTEVVKRKTDDPNGWFNRAEALYQLGKYEAAVEDYGVAIRLNSDDSEAYNGRGLSYLKLGQYDNAASDLERVIKLVPESSAARINLGDVLFAKGDFARALETFQASNSIVETATAYQRIAWALATCTDDEFRDATKAVAAANKAIEMEGETVTLLDTLAAAKAADGKFKEAEALQNKVIQLVNTESEIDEDNDDAGQAYRERLKLYESGQQFAQEFNEPVDEGSDSEPAVDDK